MCTAALNDFCDDHWPCSFVDRRGRACQIVKSRHGSKGHQNAKGKVMATGTYISKFSASTFRPEWIAYVRRQLVEVRENLQGVRTGTDSTDSEHNIPGAVLRNHKQSWTRFCFFSGSQPDMFYKNVASCFLCLMHVPQHTLPCGHVLCTACVKDFGKKVHEYCYLFERCPLHENTRIIPTPIRFKPMYAGVRVLCLDG